MLKQLVFSIFVLSSIGCETLISQINTPDLKKNSEKTSTHSDITADNTIPDITGCWDTSTSLGGEVQTSIDTFENISGNTYKQTTNSSSKTAEVTFGKTTVSSTSNQVTTEFDIIYEGTDKFIISNPKSIIPFPGEFKSTSTKVTCS